VTDPTPASWPPPPAWPAGLAPTDAAPRVPGTVQAAVIVTWICCGLTAFLTLFYLAAAAFIGSFMLDYFERSDRADLVLAAAGAAAASVALCALSSWFAWQVWRRREWARIALAVCSGLALVLSVITFGPHTVLVAPGSVAVLVLLFLSQSNDWFREV
jgi:hypothetical protein